MKHILGSKKFIRPLCKCGCGEQVETWREETAIYKKHHQPSIKHKAYYKGKI